MRVTDTTPTTSQPEEGDPLAFPGFPESVWFLMRDHEAYTGTLNGDLMRATRPLPGADEEATPKAT